MSMKDIELAWLFCIGQGIGLIASSLYVAIFRQDVPQSGPISFVLMVVGIVVTVIALLGWRDSK